MTVVCPRHPLGFTRKSQGSWQWKTSLDFKQWSASIPAGRPSFKRLFAWRWSKKTPCQLPQLAQIGEAVIILLTSQLQRRHRHIPPHVGPSIVNWCIYDQHCQEKVFLLAQDFKEPSRDPYVYGAVLQKCPNLCSNHGNGNLFRKKAKSIFLS